MVATLIFEITLSVFALSFIFLAWKTRSAHAPAQNPLLSVLGLILATFCVLPRLGLLINQFVIERYWHKPAPTGWIATAEYWLFPSRYQCMWLVPISAIASCLFLACSTKQNRFWGMSAALLGWISFWI